MNSRQENLLNEITHISEEAGITFAEALALIAEVNRQKEARALNVTITQLDPAYAPPIYAHLNSVGGEL